MAVSKRLRFEILRRDNHQCRYCGAAAPDAVLTIDHVIPKALGGSDDPSNLFTACKDCNSGKSSSAPDQATVDAAVDTADRWAAAMRRAASEVVADESPDREEIYEQVRGAWPRCYWDRIPHHFRGDIDQFIDAGLPVDVMVEMAALAVHKPGVYKRWAYFCGCCWTKIRQLQERAAEIMTEEGD